MKRSTKQMLSALLVIAMMFSLMVVPAAADVAEIPVGDDVPMAGTAEAVTLGDAVAETPVRSARAARAQLLAAGSGAKVWEANTTTGLDSNSKVEEKTEVPLGTDGFFKAVPNSTKAKTGIQDNSDTKMQTFADGYKATKRWTFDGKSDASKGFIKFTTGANPAQLQVWWISGDNDRQIAVSKGSACTSVTAETVVYASTDSVKNTPYVTPKIDLAANTEYFVCAPIGTNYFCKLELNELKGSVYTLDVDAEGTKLAVGTDIVTLNGTQLNGFFDFAYSETGKAKVEAHKDADGAVAEATFPDGSKHTNYINFGGEVFKKDNRVVKFTMAEAGGVKVWWGTSGDDRPLVIEDMGNRVTDKTKPEVEAAFVSKTTAAGSLAVDTFNLQPGTYCISGNKPYIYKIEATPGRMAVVPVDATWDEATIGKPVIGTVTQGTGEKAGTVTVNFSGVMIGTVETDTAATTYASKVTVSMLDKDGKVAATKDFNTLSDKAKTNSVEFTPAATGSYTFKAEAVRGTETPIASDASAAFSFVLPLAAPAIKTATSKGAGADGKGTVELTWNAVTEADSYNLYVGGAKLNADPITALNYTATGLTVGEKVSFTLEAVRNTPATTSAKSAAVEVTVTADEQRVWGFTNYGESSSDKFEENGYSGSVADNDLKVWSKGGKGKITDKADGVCFYYTAVPEAYNWTLTGTIHVDEWTWSNGQEGFGILATDTLGTRDGEGSVYHNNYMLCAGKSDDKDVKLRGYLGLTLIQETGYTNEYLADCKAQGITTITPPDGSVHINMDPWAEAAEITSGYNLIANCTNLEANTKNESIEKLSGGDYHEQETFKFTLQRNNTGYFATYESVDKDGTVGEMMKFKKTWKPDALSVQDTENVYVGFFTARNATISVTDVEITTILKEDDLPPEEPETVYVDPRITIASARNANTEDYNLILTSNVKGDAVVTVGSKTYTAELKVQSEETADAKNGLRRADLPIKLASGNNNVSVVFTPKPTEEQGFANDYTQLSSVGSVAARASIRYNTKFANQANLYVSPKGTAYNTGTKTSPLDIYTATQVAQPGQKIILMEGRYKLITTVTVGEGMDGTKDAPIYMIADPDATSRPVFDFQGKCVGINFSGDYWYCKGFDVTNSKEGEEGIAIAGSNNVFDQVDTYENRGSGMQISRINGYNVLKSDWPSNNIFLNCVSYLNMDSGHEDADGFGTKLTIGEGNEFYGCVAAYNCDDGWDCFAKATTGPIGVVKLYNCYAFMNGYIKNAAGDGVVMGKGNGNGLKMGGESIPGAHEVHDSYAFYNKAKGLDSNSCPDVKFYNSVSYNNQGANVALYTNNAINTDFATAGILSVKDDNAVAGKDVADNLKPLGNQVEANYKNETSYFWDKTASKNSKGASLPAAADLFVDLDLEKAISFIDVATNTVKRDANGAVSIGDFLKLKDSVSADIAAIAPKTVAVDPSKLPIVIDPAYATITPDNIPDPVSGSSSAGRDSDRGGEETGSDTANTVDSRTNANGDKIITVKDPNGEVLVDVTLPAQTPTTDKKFVDVPDEHWAADAINEMVARSIVRGVDEEHYDPDTAVTRGTLATLLFRLSNGKAGYENSFTDVAAESWYKDAVAWAAKTGVVTGYGDGTFGGDATITREQLALMLYRYAGLLGLNTTKTADLGTFADAASVDSWALDGMNWAVANGIINGVGENTLAPQASATRAQTALMLQRFIGLMQ